MRPLKALKSRSCVTELVRYPRGRFDAETAPPVIKRRGSSRRSRRIPSVSSRIVELAARILQRDLVARNDIRNLEHMRILAVRNDLARKLARHELMIAGAEIDLVRLKLDFGRKLQTLQGLGDLLVVERFRLVRAERQRMQAGIAEPGTRTRI